MKTLAIALLAASLALPAAAQTFEADNGARFRIIGTALDPLNGVVIANIADDDGRATRVMFDCHGGKYSIGTFSSVWHSIPPRSMAAQIGRNVCKIKLGSDGRYSWQ